MNIGQFSVGETWTRISTITEAIAESGLTYSPKQEGENE